MVPIQHIHPILVHFPIVLIYTLAAIDLVALARGSTVTRKSGAGTISTFLALAAGVFAIGTWFFGGLALDHAEAAGFSSDIAEIHESLGGYHCFRLPNLGTCEARTLGLESRVSGGNDCHPFDRNLRSNSGHCDGLLWWTACLRTWRESRQDRYRWLTGRRPSFATSHLDHLPRWQNDSDQGASCMGILRSRRFGKLRRANMQAVAIMSKPVVGIDPSASIAEAAGTMLFKRISGLPVIRGDGTLVGIVSEGDFLRRGELGTQRKRSRWLEFLVSPGKAADEYVHANGRRIEEVMSQDVVTASPTASLAEVVELMTRHHVKRIPVVDAGKVVGIITRSDLLRALLSVLPDAVPAAIDDEQIRQNIVTELATQKWAGKDLINVRVNNGVVKLSGAIFDERERQAAVVAAQNVAGVKAVEDTLFCADPVSVILVS